MQPPSTMLTASNLQMHNSLVSSTRPPSGNPRRPPSSGISGIAGFGIGSSTHATVAPSASSVLVAVPRGGGGCKNNTVAAVDGAASAAGCKSYAASTSRTVLSSRAANALASLELELDAERQRRIELEERLTKLSKVVETMK